MMYLDRYLLVSALMWWCVLLSNRYLVYCSIYLIYLFLMFSHNPLCCCKVDWFLRIKRPTSHTTKNHCVVRQSQLGPNTCLTYVSCNVALEISQKNKLPCAVCGSLFMLVVVLTNTAILNPHHWAVEIVSFCVFSGCVEALSQHLNEHFASARMKSFCQPPLIVDD